MYKYLFLFWCFTLIPRESFSGVLPKDGAILNYRIIGFSFHTDEGRGRYTIEVARGNFTSENLFREHIISTHESDSDHTIIEVPDFNCAYTWRVNYTGKGEKGSHSELYHFRTGYSPLVDTTSLRLHVLTNATKYNDALVFLDNSKVLCNMEGKPVWYMPETGAFSGDVQIRDMKLSCAGTITFLCNDMPYEINYSGDVLWKGPDNGIVSGARSEYYHHEFTRLSNGHYMVLGNEPGDACGTVIEYNKKGEVVWYWKGVDHFRKTGVIDYLQENNINPDVHGNSFYFDEKEKHIYLSYKNISRIVKLKYPEGTVISEYGEKYKQGAPVQGTRLFCHQHACKRSQIGCLFLFNNNGCNPGFDPKVKLLKEPDNDTGELKKIWEYDCRIADGYAKICPSGGNVVELEDRSLFVSMGGAYSRMFIVTLEKNELWSALPEKWIAEQGKWMPLSQYRASIIENKKMVQNMIWYKEFENPDDTGR